VGGREINEGGREHQQKGGEQLEAVSEEFVREVIGPMRSEGDQGVEDTSFARTEIDGEDVMGR